MHDVTFAGKEKKVAATWDELGRAQLLAVMRVVYGHYPDPNAQRLDALALLLGVSRPLLLRLTNVQLVQVFWLTDFLLGEELVFTRQLLPWVRGAWYRRKLYGPSTGLGNVRFLEFAFADAYFVAYARSGEAKWLHRLLATLYRPQRRPYRPTAADYAGDRREAFNENLVAARAEVLARLPEATQLAIFTWYRGCRRALERRYPLVFGGEQETKAAGHPDGWAYVLREISGQAFGSYDETAGQHAGQVLAKMNDDVARAQELQRQAENQKNSY